MYKRWILLIVTILLAACRQQTIVSTSTSVALPSTATRELPLPTPAPTPAIYVVQAGDTLSAIAAKFDVPVEWIAQANNIQDPNVIRVGQTLIIPGPTPIPTETVLPTATPTPDIPPQLEIASVIGRGAPGTETVVIANRGRSVSLKQWTLRDAQDNIFVFPDLYLSAGAEVRIHTGKGENTPLHLYWNRETAVWEEESDTAILADDRGVVYASKTLE
jgi:LysM repeat protein